jgi:RHS repeat-associated protein
MTTPETISGQVLEAETGLDYFGARYYSGAMGRFTSPDPLPWWNWQRSGQEEDRRQFEAYISNPQSWNMYAYVDNNPLSHTDPTGMNACGTSDDSSCTVTVTITSRSKDAAGNYNDDFTGVKNQKNYNAVAVVSVNGKQGGTFLVKTTPSADRFATLANGTYSATLTTHSGHPALRLQPTTAVPTALANPSRQDGAWLAQGILVHRAGVDNFTGIGRNGRAVSEGCQVVCTSQYPDFLRATGINPEAGSPQRHFTVDVFTEQNRTPIGIRIPFFPFDQK